MPHRLVILVLVVALAGCTGGETLPGNVVNDPATEPVAVDPHEAAAIITQLRAERGLPPVVASAALSIIAQDYADLMADEGLVAHDLDASLPIRLQRSGYAFLTVGENLGGGYRSVE